MKGFCKVLACTGLVMALLPDAGSTASQAGGSGHAARIQPAAANPRYWQYEGKPLLLLGGSREDNLFNHPEGLAAHLDLLAASGGNYIRNTMSSRNPGNVWAFKRLENGRYDLNQWDDEYWRRFETLLRLTRERGIIVQIEIWDPWDYFKSEAPRGYGPDNIGWESCPYNPKLNVNYTAGQSGLAEEIDYYSGAKPSGHLFFHTVPALKDAPLVRKYQEAFVEKILSISLSFPNVLYVMDNEVGEPPEWGQYWAKFIRARAKKAGVPVYLSDMRRNTNFESPEQTALLHDREHYDFFEISQNNANNGERHWNFIQHIRSQVNERPIPLNNVKVYGGAKGFASSVEEGTQRFWRNIFGGCASTRFHRMGPSYHFFGIGLSELAQTHIRSMRMFTGQLNIFRMEPGNGLLSGREDNEAYALSEPGRQYAVYFPAGGAVTLDASAAKGPLEVRWLDIRKNEWRTPATAEGGAGVELTAPGDGPWAVLLKAR
jgi:hypothetical protein